MKTKLFLAALLLTCPAFADDAAAPPAGPAKPASVCLRHSDVDGWGTRDKTSMIVNDRFGRKYIVGLSGFCNDIDFAFGAGFRPMGHAPAFGTCVDRGDRLVLRGGGVMRGNNSCWVNKIQLYTKDMEAADKLARENKQPLPAF
jgi:hypothetical protein